jgi:diguanylate cyclase (GGDEF)-like protein
MTRAQAQAMWQPLQTFARSPKLAIATLGATFCGLIVALFLFDLQARYHGAIDDAKNEALNNAAILSSNTVLSFDSVDRTLREAALIRAGALNGNYPTADAINAALRHLANTSPLLIAVGWTDAAGDLLAHSDPKAPPRTNIANLPHFAAQRDGDADRLLIAEPFSSAAGDRWLTAASLRLSNADGSFAGVVTAALDPSYFNQVYRTFNLHNGGSVLLLHRSGRLLAREPVVKSAIGKSFADGPLLSEFVPRSETGAFEVSSGVDGTARIGAYKVVPGLPLVVMVAYARADVLAPWYLHLYRLGTLLVLVLVALSIGTALLVKQTHSLAKKSAIVAANNQRFDIATSNMRQGLCLYDADRNLVFANRRYREIYDLPEHLVRPGTPLSRTLQYYAGRGEFSDLTTEEHVDAIPTQIRQLFQLADGRVISIQRTPMADGGWVATHEDVTEQKRGERLLVEKAAELELTNARFDAALNNMSQGLSMFDADGGLVVWNDRYLDIYGMPSDLVRRGASIESIIAHRKQAGHLDLDVEAYIGQFRQGLIDSGESASTTHLTDGRLVSVVNTAIAGGGWVAIHEDITERMRNEASVFRQATEIALINTRFDAALSNLSQGICMFDGDKRLVVWNERYAELYQLPRALLAVGTPHDAIIADRVSRGILKGETSDAAARTKIAALGQLPTATGSSRVDEFTDGRLIQVTRQPMADGGWVATHEDITERRRAEVEIAHLARHDTLTGVANRALFNEKLAEASKRHERYGDGFTVLMLDLDKFKAVNDTLGHPAGDQLLIEVARRLKAALRETDVLARLGGDEFAIIGDGGSDQHDGAIALALRIIGAIAQPFDLNGHAAQVGTSIGIALAPAHGFDPDELLQKADLALYDAKANGRNDFRLFRDDLAVAAGAQKSAENELRDAIAREEFELHYQPVIDAKTRRLCGAEALVRWRHPSKGLIGPDHFIPLAEATGLIVPLGNWILLQACRDAAAWPDPITVAVNISAVQFSKNNLFDIVLCALVETGLSPQRLELEITETARLESQEAHLTTMRQLRNLGICIALDDFGTGYSSINYLTSFPFDKIKIDKSFTRGCLNQRDCKAVVSSVMSLARGLDITTTAEGVETEEQYAYLRSIGVDLVQGFLFGRPAPVAELGLAAAASPAVMVA